MNGHRSKFHPDKCDKSALPMHIFKDHPNHIGNTPQDGLLNYNVVVLESVNALNLRTEANLRHLNRYKVLH